jgi:uncharacterized repeat protein (TIGR04076 family)
MAGHRIKCEAIKVSTATGTCPGSAKCKAGEVYILGARTPEPSGMCGRAFHAVHPMAFAMRFTERLRWEKGDGYIDITCPDDFVVYRLSRIREDKT